MSKYYLSVDLGTQRDYTAISLIERVPRELGKTSLPGTPDYANEKPVFSAVYIVRFLERLPLGLDYPTIIDNIRAKMSHEKLQRKTTLIVDATGVGLAIFQMMNNQGMHPIGLTITAGSAVTNNTGGGEGYNVPKGEIISALNLVFQSRRIKIPTGLKTKKELMKELERFQVKLKNNFTTYEAAQESVHDDLVISVAMAVWYGEKTEGSTIRGLSGTNGTAKHLTNPLKELL